MAGKHEFFSLRSKILLTKEKSELRNGFFLCIRFAASDLRANSLRSLAFVCWAKTECRGFLRYEVRKNPLRIGFCVTCE